MESLVSERSQIGKKSVYLLFFIAETAASHITQAVSQQMIVE